MNYRRPLVRKIEFVRPYLMALASTAWLFAFGWATRKGRARIVELCRPLGYHHDRRVLPELPTVPAVSVASEQNSVTILNVDAVDGNVSEKELVVLCRLVATKRPMRLFELGTFDGRTTSNLAVNSPEGARVFTLDLLPEWLSFLSSELDPRERRYVEKEEPGRRYRGSIAEEKITTLFGDSLTFDFSPYFESIDFVFVDASHAFDYVMSDSLNAFRMLPPNGGTIVWHDFGHWDGVTEALNRLSRDNPEFADLKWIEGTTLAILERGSPTDSEPPRAAMSLQRHGESDRL